MLSSLAAECPGPWRSCAARFAPTSHCCPPPDDPGTGVRPTCSACGIMNRSHVRVNQVSGCSLYSCTPTEQVSNLLLLSLSRWPRNWWLSAVLFLSHHEQFSVRLDPLHGHWRSMLPTTRCCGPSVTQESLFAQYTVSIPPSILSRHQQLTVLGWTHSVALSLLCWQSMLPTTFCCGPSVAQEPLFAQYTVTSSTLHSVRLDPQSVVLMTFV